MGFKAALDSRRTRPALMFEPVPPPKDTPPAAIEDHLDALRDALGAVPYVDGVNVPQIVGGSYETVEALDYAAAVQATTGVEALVNRIVALQPAAELAAWIDGALAADIRHLILVGGESSDIRYPGPSVKEANRLAARRLEPQSATIGNICIPFRRRRGRDEPDRMVEKTAAGAEHFTSQIILEPLTTRRLLRDYERACRHAGVTPATVFIGLAPVTERKDLALLKNLGVEVPPHVERELLWDRSEIALRSLQLNLGILRSVLASLREENIRVPVGLNVEQVSLRNWDASVELASEATLLLEEHAWLLEDALVAESPPGAAAPSWHA